MASAGTIKAGGAYVELTANDSKLRSGLAGAETRLARFGAGVGSLQKRMNGMSYGFAKTAQSVNAVSTGFLSVGGKLLGVGMAMGGALGYAVKHFMAIGDQMDKMSARTGATVEWLSQMRYVADLSGTGIEKLESSLTNMNKSLADAAEGRGAGFRWLQQLGIDLNALKGMDTAERFESIADGISRVEDSAIRARMTTAIFRDSGALLPLIGEVGYELNLDIADNKARKTLKQLGLDAQEMMHLTPDMQVNAVKSALAQINNEQKRKSLKSKTLKEKPSNIQQQKDEAVKLGVGISTDQAKKAAELNDAFSRLKFTVSGLAVTIGGTLAPHIEKLANSVAWYLPKITEFVEKNGGAIMSVAQLALIIGSAGLAFSSIGAAMLPVVWGFQALSIGAKGIASAIGLGIKAWGKFGEVTKNIIRRLINTKTNLVALKNVFLTAFFGPIKSLVALGGSAKKVMSLFGNTSKITLNPLTKSISVVGQVANRLALSVRLVWRAIARVITGSASIKSSFGAMWSTMTMIWSGMGLQLGLVLGALGGLIIVGVLIYKNWSTIVGVLKAAGQGILNFFKSVFSLIMSGVRWVMDSIKNMVEDVKAVLTESFGMIVQAFKLGDIKSVFEILQITVSSVLLAIKKHTLRITSEFLTFWHNTFIYVGERGALIFAGLWYGIKVGWGATTGWLAYALDMAWLYMKHSGGNAIAWYLRRWMTFFRTVAGMFIRLFAFWQKNWIRLKALINKDIDVNVEMKRVDDEADRKIAEMKAKGDHSEDDAKRNAEQKEEREMAKRYHDDTRSAARNKLDGEYDSEKARIKQNTVNLIDGYKPFEGAIGAVTDKLNDNAEKLAKIRQRLDFAEKAKAKGDEARDKPAAEKKPKINIDALLGSFRLKDFSFGLDDKDSKITSRQDKQIELQNRANRLLQDLNTRRHNIDSGLVFQ